MIPRAYIDSFGEEGMQRVTGLETRDDVRSRRIRTVGPWSGPCFIPGNWRNSGAHLGTTVISSLDSLQNSISEAQLLRELKR